MKQRSIKDVLADTRPQAVVEISFTVHDDESRTVSLDVPFESQTNCVVAVPLNGATLSLVVQEIHASSDDGTRYKKRPREEWFKSKYKEIKKNYQRNSMYVAYRNSDGEIKTLHAKPVASDVPEIEEERIHETEEHLHQQYQELHHGSELSKAEQARAVAQDNAEDDCNEEPVGSECGEL